MTVAAAVEPDVAPIAGPIVLGTDFGPASAAAELRAIQSAAAAHADLVIVHAIDPGRLRLPGGRWRERVDQARSRREASAASLVALARSAGVSARTLIWNGDPATCVADAARAEGARQKRSVARFLREVVAELRKVIWPGRRELITYTTVVIVFVAFIVALVAGLDLLFAKGVIAVFG